MKSNHFRPQNGPFAKNDIFSGKTIKLIMYLLAPSIMQNFKKILKVDLELWQHAIFKPKWPICPKWEFFQENH